MSEWIKCSERLPDNRAGVFYLAVNSAGYMDKISHLTVCDQPPDEAPVITYSGWLHEHGRSECTIGSVTHWQPLPPPPAD